MLKLLFLASWASSSCCLYSSLAPQISSCCFLSALFELWASYSCFLDTQTRHRYILLFPHLRHLCHRCLLLFLLALKRFLRVLFLWLARSYNSCGSDKLVFYTNNCSIPGVDLLSYTKNPYCYQWPKLMIILPKRLQWKKIDLFSLNNILSINNIYTFQIYKMIRLIFSI